MAPIREVRSFDGPMDQITIPIIQCVSLLSLILLIATMVSLVRFGWPFKEPSPASHYKNRPQRRGRRLTRLASRTPRDARELLHVDKLDKYLDLGPLIKCIYELVSCNQWSDFDNKKWRNLINDDTREMLRRDDIPPGELITYRVDPTLPSKLLLTYLRGAGSKSHMGQQAFRNTTAQIGEASRTAVYLQVKHMISHMSPTLHRLNDQVLSDWLDRCGVMPGEIIRMLAVSEDWMKLLEVNRQLMRYSHHRSASERVDERLRDVQHLQICPSFGAEVKMYQTLTLMVFNKTKYILNHDLFLECHNKACETFCALLYSWQLSITVLPLTHLEQVVEYLIHLASVVERYGSEKANPRSLHNLNKGFTYLKAIEALGVATIIAREDAERGWVNTTLSEALWASLEEAGLVYSSSYQESDLYAIFSRMQIAQIAEILGIIKLCGHPSIEVEVGLRKLYERTHNNITVDPTAVARSIGILTRDLTKNYFRKHGKYPVFDTSQNPLPRALATLVNSQTGLFSTTRGRGLWSSITLDQWSGVRFGKNAEFDIIENRLPLLKDKAIGLIRTKAYKLLLAEIGDPKVRGENSREKRRVLLQYLLSPYMDEETTQYLNRYSNDDVWDSDTLDYMVIKLTPKELEEKPEGRMFGASPVPERNRRIIQEYNVMQLMDMYIDDQIMTPDELSMIRKLYSFRCFHAMYPNHSLLQVSFDFSRWNNNMRSASIDVPGAALLDRWFGTKLFGKTMRFYQNALVYYHDGDTKRSWEGQEGGIEGLNQATWSLVFIGGIKQALEELGLSYQLTVKGDDVRAAIAIDNNLLRAQGPEVYRDWVLNQLLELCTQMGWQLNPQECFVSLTVIATSKQYQVNDTWLPASTKKMMKALSLTNVVFPMIEDIVAGAYSTAHSAANQSPVLLPGYYTATLVAARELLRRFDDLVVSTEALVALLVWPQCLGGPGALPLQTYFVRGENDMLAVSISLLRYLQLNGSPELHPHIVAILSQAFSTERDPKLLLMDPYSLSLDTPERPQARLKKLVRQAIKRYTQNPDLVQLLTMETADEEQAWSDHLLSMVPYHAKVATVLWENSPFYLIEEILAKFMQSVTVFDFLCYRGAGVTDRKQGYQALGSVLESERKRYKYWKRIILSQDTKSDTMLGIASEVWDDLRVCTTELVHRIRAECWGRRIVGLTYPSLVDQNILTTPEDAAHLAPEWNMGQIANTIHIDPESCRPQTTDNSIHYSTLPDNTPWLGAVTSGKARLPGLATKVQSPTISKIMKLIYLKSAGSDLGQEFQATVMTALRALTTIDISQLRVLDPEISGGHIPHRTAMNSYSMTTMPNSRPNLIQLIRMDETCPAILRGDLSNRTINYAARYFYGVFASLMPLQMSTKLPQGYPKMVQIIFHEDPKEGPHYAVCPHCCNIVDGDAPSFSVKQRPNLTHYCAIPLVGSSEHDKAILLSAIHEAIGNRARKYATEVYGDPANPIIQQVATQVVLGQFGRDAQKVYEAAMGSGFMRVPQGKLLEALSVTMGVRALSRVSINLLRCAQPDYLYSYLLSTLIHWFIGTVGFDIDTCPVEKALQTQSHLSSLSGLLSQMTTAGVMGRICTGALLVQGPDFVLRWGPQDLKDSSSAVQTFIRVHEDLLLRLCNDPTLVSNIRLFLDFESSEEIRDRIGQWRAGVQNFILSRLLNYMLKYKIFKIFNWPKCCERLQLDEDPDTWNEDDMVKMQTWFRDKIEGDEPILMAYGWIYGIMQSHTLLVPMINDCEEPEAAIDYSNPVMLFRTDGEAEVEPVEWSQGYIVNHDGGMKLGRVFHRNKVEIMFNVVMDVLDDTSLNYPITGLKEARIFILRMLGPLNNLTVLSMTLEDAERIMKSQAYTLVTAAKTMQTIVDDEQDGGEPQDNRQTVCALGRDGAHEDHVTAGGLVYLGEGGDIEEPHPALTGCQVLTKDPFHHRYLLDVVDLCRGVGYNNTSVAKFAEVLVGSGIVGRHVDRGTPMTIVCAADGLGGVTALMLRTFRRADVIYNSLYIIPGSGQVAGDANVYNPPTEVLALPPDVQWDTRLHYKGLYPGDLNEVGVRDNIMNLVAYTKRPVSILTFDAEIPRDETFNGARQLWASLVDLILRMRNPNLLVMVKLFALNTSTVYRVLNCLSYIFRHFHVHRCEATRSHATEFIFVGSEPREELHVGLQSYVRGTVRFSERAGVNAYIARMLGAMADIYRPARDEGTSTAPHLSYLYRLFNRLDLPPTPVACHNRALGIKVRLAPDHLCDSLVQVRDNITFRIEQLQLLVKTMESEIERKEAKGLEIRHRFQLSGVRGDVVAQGPAAMLKFIKSAWKVIASKVIWNAYLAERVDLRNLCRPAIFREQLTQCLGFVADSMVFAACSFDWRDGEVIMQCGGVTESVTLLVRSSAQRTLQMVGASLYAFSILAREEATALSRLVEYYPGMRVEQCCQHTATTREALIRTLGPERVGSHNPILVDEETWLNMAARTGITTYNPDYADIVRERRNANLEQELARATNDALETFDWAEEF